MRGGVAEYSSTGERGCDDFSFVAIPFVYLDIFATLI